MLATILRKRSGRLLLLGCATLALLLLAAGISSLKLDDGEARAVAPLNEEEVAPAITEAEPIPVDLEAASPLFLLLVVLLTVTVVVGMFRSKAIRVTVVTLIGVATAVVIITELVLANVDRTTSETTGVDLGALLPEAPEEAAVPAFVREPKDWMTTLIGSLLVTLAAAGGWAFWYTRRRPPADEKQALDSLARDAQLTLGALRTGGDVRDAVLNAYLQMSQTVRKMDGLARGASMTPHEFEQQLVRAGLPARAVTRLTRLFEQVRYGGVTVGERERREAIACMETIVDAASARRRARNRTPLEAMRF